MKIITDLTRMWLTRSTKTFVLKMNMTNIYLI